MSAKLDRARWLGGIRRAVGSLWARAGATVLLLGIVGLQLDWSQIGDRLRSGEPIDFLFAVVVLVVALCVAAWRWHALLAGAGMPMRRARLARIYAVSTFSSTFLPTSMGGDVARTLLVTRRGPLLPRVAMTVVVDRLGGFVGLIGLAWIAFLADPIAVPDGSRIFLASATLVCGVAGVGTVMLALWGPRALRQAVPARLLTPVRDARALLVGYARDPALMTLWTVLSFVNQALIALQLMLLARAIDVELAYTTAAVALALVTILTLIPISIGGFGVREGSYVVLLGGASIAAADATLISVLSVAALFVASLPGAYLIIRGRVGAAPEATPA
jgi:glycosyltransferase 2 family protein